jgi:hypothetical protein
MLRPPEKVEKIRQAYEDGDASVGVVATMFGISRQEIFDLAREHGWSARSDSNMTPREKAIAVRAAEVVREVELYGDAIADVKLLRQRGFLVVREGDRCRVGNSLCSLADLRAKASRERRLTEAASSMLAVRHPPEHRAAG